MHLFATLTVSCLTPEEVGFTTISMSLLGSSQPVRSRTDGAIVRRKVSAAAIEAGADADGIAAGTEAMTHELFGCSSRQLYKDTGGKRGDRKTLPEVAQEAYVVGEVVATHDLNQEGPFQGSQDEKNAQTAGTMGGAGRKVKGFFPWNRSR